MNYNINLQDIADKLDFDLEDVEMIMEAFLEGANESLLALKEAIDKNDFEEIYMQSHAIKGSAANITLMNISDLAKEMESGANEKKELDYSHKYENLYKIIKNI